MEKYIYLIINFAVISIPLLLTFYPTVYYYKKIKPLMISTFLIGGVFIIWDIWFTELGIWSFNEKFITGFKFFNLPIEEVLFFITVPYSCIFIYESLKYYLSLRDLRTSTFIRSSLFIIGLCMAFFGLLSSGQDYTFFISIFSGSFALILSLRLKENIDPYFILYLALGLIGFLIVNTVLTALPVVEYSELHITQLRVYTIPVEDFFYYLLMNSLYLMTYLHYKKRYE